MEEIAQLRASYSKLNEKHTQLLEDYKKLDDKEGQTQLKYEEVCLKLEDEIKLRGEMLTTMKQCNQASNYLQTALDSQEEINKTIWLERSQLQDKLSISEKTEKELKIIIYDLKTSLKESNSEFIKMKEELFVIAETIKEYTAQTETILNELTKQVELNKGELKTKEEHINNLKIDLKKAKEEVDAEKKKPQETQVLVVAEVDKFKATFKSVQTQTMGQPESPKPAPMCAFKRLAMSFNSDDFNTINKKKPNERRKRIKLGSLC